MSRMSSNGGCWVALGFATLGLTTVAAPCSAAQPALSTDAAVVPAVTASAPGVDSSATGNSAAPEAERRPDAQAVPAAIVEPAPAAQAAPAPALAAPDLPQAPFLREADIATSGSVSEEGPTSVESPKTDHEVAGRLAIGLGVFAEPNVFLPIVVNSQTGTSDTDDNAVPMLLGRYWFGVRKSWAVELGLSYSNGEIFDAEGTGAESESFYVRLGVPVTLASTQHTTFEVIPHVSYFGGEGHAEQGYEQDLAFSEWTAALRLVAELHFGFIDVPELSLQSGVGMQYSRLLLRARTPGFSSALDGRYVATALRAVGGSGPWDIVIGNLSALYHF